MTLARTAAAQAAEVANVTATWALWIAGVAAVISLIAAIFTGWQAVTSHLARTSPGKARWVLKYPKEHEPPWILANVGGSVATDIRLTVRNPLAKRSEQTFTAGVIWPTGAAALEGSEWAGDPRDALVADPSNPNRATIAKITDRHAYYPYAQDATIEWRDHRGRRQSERLPLR